MRGETTDAIVEGEDEELAAEDAAEELLDVFKTIERHRNALHEAADYFRSILADEPELRRQWDAFTRAGGITSLDFRRFLDGDVFRYHRIRRRKHLRLVINQRTPMVIKRSGGGGHAA